MSWTGPIAMLCLPVCLIRGVSVDDAGLPPLLIGHHDEA